MPIPTTPTPTLSDNVASSLEEMTELICCLEGITDDVATNGDNSSFQLAAKITSELLTWNGDATWNTINQLSDASPISLLDRLDDVAQVMGSQLEVGEVLRADTPTMSCILESNTVEEFSQKDWIFKPFQNTQEQITIKGSDLLSSGQNKTNKISILGVAHTNITEILNNHQTGTNDNIIADVISATVFTPTGRFSSPASFKRQITNLTGSVNASMERVSFCGFWDDFLYDTEIGGWSTEGCQRVDVLDEEFIEDNVGDLVSCYCNHTTNYAILMRIVPIRVRRRRKVTTSKPTEPVKHTTNLLTTTPPPIVTTGEATTTTPTTTYPPKVTTEAVTEVKHTTIFPTTTSPPIVTTGAVTNSKPTKFFKHTTLISTTRSPKPTTWATEAITKPTKFFKHTTLIPTTRSPKPTTWATEAITKPTKLIGHTTNLLTSSPRPIVTTLAETKTTSKPTEKHSTGLSTTTAPKPTIHVVTTEAVTEAKSASFNPTNQATARDVISTSNQSAASNSNVSVINDTVTDESYYYYYYYYPVDAVSESILDVLNLIGCIMSIVALIVALVCFIVFRHSSLDTERILIHMNLMGSLLIAMTLFLISLLLTSYLIPCKIIAMVLHYLYLVVFSWMLVEGIHLYRLIVTVYGSEKQMAKFYCLLGWGSPLLIVGISSSATQLKGYGVPNLACWLSAEDGFIWAFVAPVCVIMLVNFLVLCMVIKTTVTALNVCKVDNMTKVKTGLRSSLVLLPLLGISWGVGLVAHLHVAFQYTFVLMNSFQGVWLVTVCCVMNGEVRNAFKIGIKKKLGRYSGSVSATVTLSTSDSTCKTGMDGKSTLTEVGQ
ncbi:adhesion G-protein coupled receptor D1-like [Asterias rubens]|uniref:adhesion G-protein coupled receptor D1-like n=1 Tax=Asterias rubens TaxID=7604 RepID=UPI0014559067|nr:adhesion G-protein coupled receptor D1-like [Asterias rubens]